MGRLTAVAATLGVFAVCAAASLGLYRTLLGGDWQRLAPPPPAPQAVAPMRLPEEAKAPQFKFFTGGPGRPAAPAFEPAETEPLAVTHKKIIKKIKIIKKKKRRGTFKARGLSSTIGGQAESSAYFESAQPASGAAVLAPAPAAASSSAPTPRRRMRALAPAKVVVPLQAPRETYPEEESVDYSE